MSRGSGAVINISSAAAHRPCPQLAAYTASKVQHDLLCSTDRRNILSNHFVETDIMRPITQLVTELSQVV